MTARRILITGGSGFVGGHLTRLLTARGDEVTWLQRTHAAVLPPGVREIAANLEERDSLKKVRASWDWVVHLAGASIPSQFKDTDPIVKNVHMTLNLLEHLQEARVLLVSSCHVYAPSRDIRTESSPIVPQGRYGLSKHLVEQMASHYGSKLDLFTVRPFNHLGPGQRPELVIPSLINRLRDMGPNGREPVVMKGTDSIRDFIDIRDVVSAYVAILELGQPRHASERCFNVCTGHACSIREVVQQVLKLMDIHRPIAFEGTPNSTDDNPFLVGSPERLTAATGWTPQYSLQHSLEAMLTC